MARIPVPAVLGFYDDPNDILHVGELARTQEHFKNLDAYTPFPIHGIEEALGIGRSYVGTAARIALLTGWFLGFVLQSWTAAVDWPVIIGGKPYISWPAWIPVTFESGVLMAAFANLFALFFFAHLWPRPKTILLSRRITHDRFVLVIPTGTPEEEVRAVAFLEAHNALKIKIVDGIDKKNDRVIFRAAPLASEVAHA